jgi:hypothetical protein
MSRLSDYEFDRMLDEHQEREREDAVGRAVIGDIEARRPDAERREITFAELCCGDYMTNEDGPAARWVKVEKIDGTPATTAEATVTFVTPQPLGVALEDHWIIRRTWDTPVTIDAAVRSEQA